MNRGQLLEIVELTKIVDDRPKVLRDLIRRPSSFHYYKFFVHLAQAMKPELIVELGTNQGVGAVHFRHGTKTAKIITVDIKRTQKIEDRLFAHDIEGVIYDATKYAEQVEDGTVDICFVDANHMYEDVKSDTAAWIPKMREGGVMLFDDIWLKEYPPGVETGMRKFWDELEGDFEKLEVKYLHPSVNFGVVLF